MAKPSEQPQAAVGHAGLARASQCFGQHRDRRYDAEWHRDRVESGCGTFSYGYQVDEIAGRAADAALASRRGEPLEADIMHRVLTDRRTERYEARPGSARTGR